MDYRKLLGKPQTHVAPWLGGDAIETGSGRFRLAQVPASPGWYTVSISRGEGTIQVPTDAPDLSALPKVRGHLWGNRLVQDGAVAEALWLMPADEPPRFSPCVARRWHSDDLLFEELPFEGDAEEFSRRAWEEDRGLAEVRGVPATLRAAFGYALAERVGHRLGIRFAPAELRQRIAAIAEGGPAAAEAALRALEAERELARKELVELDRRRREEAAREEVRAERERRAEAARRRGETAQVRAEAALRAAGATLRDARLVGDQLEVIFTFMGERFISLADAATLQVVDSGICLGHPPRDDLVTLESLPSVIREAIETDALVILRHA